MGKRLIWWALAGMIFVISTITLGALAQWLEPRYLPVVKDFRITSQVKVGKSLQISGEMTKVRESCRFQEVSAYSGKAYLHLTFPDVPPSMLGTSRAAGEQAWGPWLVTPYHDKIRLIVRHRCHALWDTTTVLIDQ